MRKKEKKQRYDISRMRLDHPRWTTTSCYMGWGGVADIINHAKFLFRPMYGFWLPEVSKFAVLLCFAVCLIKQVSATAQPVIILRYDYLRCLAPTSNYCSGPYWSILCCNSVRFFRLIRTCWCYLIDADCPERSWPTVGQSLSIDVFIVPTYYINNRTCHASLNVSWQISLDRSRLLHQNKSGLQWALC